MTPFGAPTEFHPVPDQHRGRVVVLLFILIVLFGLWWKQQMPLQSLQAPPRYVATPPPHIPTEQEWVVGQIGRRIAETAAFAKTGKSPHTLRLETRSTRERPEHYQFQSKLNGSELPSVQLDVQNYLWDPDNFTRLARQLIGLRDGANPSQRSAIDAEIFQRLVRPTPEVLIREDKRLSEAMTQNPLDPELHEEAALLTGSFALRHTAARFYDVRRELSSITAHLAIARALDKNVGPCGELAEAILLTLCGRQSAALEILQHLDRGRDTTRGLPMEMNTIWNRALTMRNTGDYRKLDQPEHASLFERLEYVRALRYSVSSEAASNFLLHFPAERLAEWSNLILAGGFSVSDGHLWTERAFQDELDETLTTYRAYHGMPLDSFDLATPLNTPATFIRDANDQTARVEVLGWGMWAQLHQRQLCQIFDSTLWWLQDQYDAPEEAQEFKTTITKQFSQLELFRLVGMETEHDRSSAVHNDVRAAQLCQEKPEAVPFNFWSANSTRLSRAAAKTFPVLQRSQWFSPTFPVGTLYDVAYRCESTLPQLPQSELDKLKAVAPYNNRVVYHQMRTATPRITTPDQLAAQFDALVGYDAWSMEVVANGSLADPDRYEAAFTRLCQLNPNQYLQLGRYLCEHQRYEAAARAYEKAIELAPDRVHVSNTVGWLVDYYYTHNRQTEAFAVAEMAAQVYSARGLRTMAQLCERAGRLLDAETYFRKQAERYEEWEDVALFYSRHPNEPKFATAFAQMMPKVFPSGEEPADVNSMKGSPADGVLFTTTSKTIESLGLQKGDVLVAINGVRIHNKSQYFYKMDSAASARTELIVWSRGSYRSSAADLPNHRLGVEISNYQPPTVR